MTNETLPTAIQPSLTDIEIQVARIRAAGEAVQAQQYKAEHDNFSPHFETPLPSAVQLRLAAIAFNYSDVASRNFNLPTDES